MFTTKKYTLCFLAGSISFAVICSITACKNDKVTELTKQAKEQSGKGNHYQAKELLSEALQIQPDNISCLRARALEEESLNDFKSVLSDENRILQVDPKLIGIHIARAYCEQRLHDTNSAISDYKQLLKQDSNNGEGYCGLGRIALHRKDTAVAINFFSECKAHDTNECEAYGEMGWIEMNRKLYKEADQDTRKEIKLAIAEHSKTGIELGFRCLGLIKKRVHDTLGALRAFNSIIEYGYILPIDYYNKALVELELKDTDNALQDCVEGCKCDTGDEKEWRPYYLKSYIEYEKHQYSLSFIDAEKEIKLAPDNRNGYYRRGLAHIKLGNKEMACEDFNKSKELGSKWADSVMNLYCK